MVVGADWIASDDDRSLWVASSNGFVKRSLVSEYPRKGRATGGVATMQLTPKTRVGGAAVLGAGEDCLLIAESGRAARLTADTVAVVARDRKGVTGLRLEGADTVVRLVPL